MKMMKLDKGKMKDVELDMLKELKKAMDTEMLSDDYSEEDMDEESEMGLPGEEMMEETSEMLDEMPYEEDSMGKLVVKTDDPELLQKIKDLLLSKSE